MRLICYKDFDGKIKEKFVNSFGIPLTQNEKSYLGLSHLERVQKIFDSHELCIGLKMKEYDKIGAISIKGEVYASFIYDSFEGVTCSGYSNINDNSNQELWMGKKDGDLYDIYHLDQFIYEDAIGPAHLIIDDYTNDNINYQYAQIVTEDGYKIYDIFNKQFLNFTAENAISHIHSKYQRIILSRSRYLSNKKYEYTHILIDFDGHVIGKYVGENKLRFTKNPDFFETYGNGKSGLLILENGNFEEVIPQKYKDITQIFKNKAVVINTQNCVKIIYFEKKLKKNIETWVNKLDSYKFPKEVIAGFFLEDESEGILTLSNGKKILLSLFLQGNDEKYQCEDIFYEGNKIFKCYKFKGTDTATITFIYKGQSILTKSKDKDGHIVEIEENGIRKKILFTPDGNKIDVDIPFYQTVNRFGSKKYYSYDSITRDFMTIPKEEVNNLVMIHSDKVNVVNLIKGTNFRYNYLNPMIWHNIYSEKPGYKLHTVRGNEGFLNSFNKCIACFNDYAVFDSVHQSIFILNKDFDVMEIKSTDVEVDTFYRKCIIKTKNNAYVVSNEGIEEFNDIGKTIKLPDGIHQIYKSNLSENYVIGTKFVDATLLKYEASNGTIDAKFASL